MSDQNENRKSVKNQLFSASVTGGTFEDFSQNAVLHPVENVPVSSLFLNSSQDPIESSVLNSFHQQGTFLQDIQASGNQSESSQQQSSVFSSFSNILTFGEPSNPQPLFNPNQQTFATQVTTQPDKLLESPLIGISNSLNVDGLFCGNSPLLPPTSTLTSEPVQGSNNLYQRSGLKKPTYAQIPGLSSSKQSFVAALPTGFLQPKPTASNYFQPYSNEQVSPQTSHKTTASNISGITSVELKESFISPSILQPEDPATILKTSTALKFDNNLSSPNSTVLNPVFPAPLSTQTILNSPMTTVSNTNTTQVNQNNIQTSMAASKFSSSIYRPVYHHWFHMRIVEGRTLWQPFSMLDSLALEQAFTSADISPNTVVATDGGRYDVNILRRERYSVYWASPPTEVRRSSWFHKGNSEGRFIPYEENIATMLEEEYKMAYETNEWHRKVELLNGDTVVFHGPDVLILFPPSQATPDMWENSPQSQLRPKVVKRGMDEFDIDEGEPATVDHLLFIVHGIGSVCDLKFRSVEDVVDEFRAISLQLVQSHYRTSCDTGVVNRVEVLPISWHSKLHSEDTGIDKKLKNITLKSIPRLRDFTNDTLLDILFYTSPIYCQTMNTNNSDSDCDDDQSVSIKFSTRVPYQQTIITTVGTELNRIYNLFKQRNPSFSGEISLGGHSLGSLILFDILSHQHVEHERHSGLEEEDIVTPLKKPHPKDRRLNRRISYMMSEAGTGQPQLQYPHLDFHPRAFFALGSPIAMFVTVRGLDKLGKDFALPTCPAFFNIFHPYDPVAYRIESLINPELADLKPVQIPHHKGRKRMHLELRDTMARVSADLKQKLVDSMKSTWNTFFQMALFGKQESSAPSLEAEVDKVLGEKFVEEEETKEFIILSEEDQNTNLNLGILNKGRRMDYVLQEAPLESFNEYLFALTSHVCYWDSEDTMLLILKEIYSSTGINPDNQIPQQTMTVERRSPSPNILPQTSQTSKVFGMNPTLPMCSNTNLGPPPTSGFMRK